MENNRVFGSFKTVDEALREIMRLESLGYTRDEISIVAKDKNILDEVRGIASDDTGSGLRTGFETVDSPVIKSKIPDSVANEGSLVSGAATGAALGGIGGLLLAAGTFVIPGIGPILAAGPIAAVIAGAATGGIVGGALGGVVGVFNQLDFPEEDKKLLNEKFNEGEIIVYTKPKTLVDQNKDNIGS